MNDHKENNKRIAKNTLMLYARMLLVMFVSLYTSRVVINSLGISDYGIYNVIGGFVTMFSIFYVTVSGAISRFITVNLGTGDIEKLKRVFSTSIVIQLIIIAVIVILLESFGLWFINNKMVIPQERLDAANWVFQLSVVTIAISCWSIPYNAAIVAHEKMNIFAFVGIFEAISKLTIAFAIVYNPFDKLVYYAFLIMLLSVIVRIIYGIYCKKHFEECDGRLCFDKKLLCQMFGFSGWNFVGSSAAIIRDQGGNVVLNLFCGPTVNAARGIAMSVNSAVSGFATNFMTAINPQIMKSYANEDWDYLKMLVCQSARLSFYILFLLGLPIIITTPYLLKIWLGIVPDYAITFTRLILIFSMSESLASSLGTALLANGNIKNYQLLVGGVNLLNIPLSYLFLKIGFAPEVTIIIAIFLSVICEFLRLFLLKKYINFQVRYFIRNIYMNVILVSVSAFFIPVLFLRIFPIIDLPTFIAGGFISIVSALFSILFIGCNKNDRELIYNIVQNKLHKNND